MSGLSNNQNTKAYDATADSGKVVLYDESGNVINSSNPLPATAVITGDMNVDTNSVAGMLIGKSGGGDFTAVSAGLGAVITIGTMPYPHTFIADDIISVQQISSGGAVSNTYTRDDATMTVATGTALTITGATFAVDDTFVVYTNIPKVIVDDANTARTTATQVQPTQNIGANGNPMPSGVASDPIYITTGIGESIIGDGRQAVATPGTAVALAASTAIKEVTVTAELSNTGTITVGSSNVVDAAATRRGIPLYAGSSFTISTDNLAEVFIDAEISNDGVSYVYLA